MGAEKLLMNKVKFVAAVLGIAILLAGCSNSITSSDLIGVYQANHSKGTETIELLSSGIYKQKIKFNTGKVLTTVNKWRFGVGSANEVSLDSAISVDLDGQGGPGVSNVDWSMEARKSGKELTLNFDDDLGVFFKKIK